MMVPLPRAALAVLFLAAAAHAHTWIDCLDTDLKKIYEHSQESVNGKGFCNGYTKNYVGRGPDTNVDRASTFKILMDDVAKGQDLCSPDAPDYTDWRHRLKVKAGEAFYFGYLDNGHTSKDQAGRGSYYGTYWTGVPDTSLQKTTDLKPELLVDGLFHDYDDGTCGESKDANGGATNRAGEGIPCIGEASIPAGTKPGIYNLVWFWKFYKEEGGANKLITTQFGSFGGAAYTQCYQVEVVGDDAPPPAPAPAGPGRPVPPRAARPPSVPSGASPATPAAAETPATPAPAPASDPPATDAPAPATPATDPPAPAATEEPATEAPAPVAVAVEEPATVGPAPEVGEDGDEDSQVKYVVVNKKKKRKKKKLSKSQRKKRAALLQMLQELEDEDDDEMEIKRMKKRIASLDYERKRALRTVEEDE